MEGRSGILESGEWAIALSVICNVPVCVNYCSASGIEAGGTSCLQEPLHAGFMRH